MSHLFSQFGSQFRRSKSSAGHLPRTSSPRTPSIATNTPPPDYSYSIPPVTSPLSHTPSDFQSGPPANSQYAPMASYPGSQNAPVGPPGSHYNANYNAGPPQDPTFSIPISPQHSTGFPPGPIYGPSPGTYDPTYSPAPGPQYDPSFGAPSYPHEPYPPSTQYNLQPSVSGSPTFPSMSPRFSYRENREVGADHYEKLAKFDTVFLIDDSGSMSGSNWEQTSEALAAIVPICTTYDADGIDIYFLNNPKAHTHIRSAREVLSIFADVRPAGATPTGRKLGELLSTYMKSYKSNQNIKPMNIIVITDGEPTDPLKLEKAIVSTAKELDSLQASDRQIGVQFFQVGSDEAATESLEELDNSLVEEWNVRDMVDTVSWKKMNSGNGLSADGILKVVMGGVDKHLDRRRRV